MDPPVTIPKPKNLTLLEAATVGGGVEVRLGPFDPAYGLNGPGTHVESRPPPSPCSALSMSRYPTLTASRKRRTKSSRQRTNGLSSLAAPAAWGNLLSRCTCHRRVA